MVQDLQHLQSEVIQVNLEATLNTAHICEEIKDECLQTHEPWVDLIQLLLDAGLLLFDVVPNPRQDRQIDHFQRFLVNVNCVQCLRQIRPQRIADFFIQETVEQEVDLVSVNAVVNSRIVALLTHETDQVDHGLKVLVQSVLAQIVEALLHRHDLDLFLKVRLLEDDIVLPLGAARGLDPNEQAFVLLMLAIGVKEQFTAVVLVTSYSFVVAAAQLTKQREESLVLLGTRQVVHNVFDDGHVDLFVQQLAVVAQYFLDGVLGEEVVLIGRHHTLVEEVRDPLGHIELVEVVVFHAVFQQSVNQLTHFGHWTSLGQLLQFVERLRVFVRLLEWIYDDVN